MASEYSFDIAAKVDRQKLAEAIDLTKKEVATRFDFKGAKAEINIEKDTINLEASDEMRIKQLIDVFENKLTKREISLKAFKYGKFETNVSGVYKCKVDIQNGLSQEQCKIITKMIKDAKVKAQPRIQGDTVRVVGKSKDELQEVIAMVRKADLDFLAVFENFK
jgi:cyclic-di-GMP-binding protein